MQENLRMQQMMAFLSKPKNHSPHAIFLGLEIVEVSAGRATVRIPYADKLAGSALTGVLHGGVITTVLDSACGLAVVAALTQHSAIATLDLRIDYLKPATPGESVTAAGHCYKVTRNVCFVRGLAYHTDSADPIANCAASFMLSAAPRGDQGGAGEPP